MKNFTLKMIVMTCMLFFAGYTYAQFNMNTNTNIGQVYSVDTVQAVGTFAVNFNTAKDSSFWKYTDETNTTFAITLSKCQTQRGLQVNVYAGDTANAPKIINGDFECRDYGANRNPVRVASVKSLLEILQKYELLNAGTADAEKNVTWKPSACLFDVNKDPLNQAFGAHPGMYKVVEYGFQYNFAGKAVSEDISFEIDTYDAGNTGLTASYTLTVATGSATNIIATVDNFYVTGSGKKTVNLAEVIGKTPADFSNLKVYFFLKTMGTGTPMSKSTVDPTIVFDNFSVSFPLPQWIIPATGLVANAIFENAESPLVGNLNEENMFSLHLKTAGRLGVLSIINDLQNPTKKVFSFPETMAIKANDGSGNYTVEVPYTLTPAVLTAGAWSKAKIEIAAPVTGSVNDDLMLYFNATPTSLDAAFDRLELNCGTRIWYDVYFKGVDIPTTQEWNMSSASFNALGSLTAKTTVEGLTIYAATGKSVDIDANNKSIDGMDFTHRLKLGGSGEFVEGVPTSRILAFNVAGNTTITIAGMSSSSSADRTLTIAAGTMDNVIGTFPALGAAIGKQDFEYVGGVTTIYVFSPSSGVNIYYMKATDKTTSVSDMKVASDIVVYPNPATKYAKVRFSLTQKEEVSLTLFNMVGQAIEISKTKTLFEGVNEININTQSLKSGLYIYRLKVGSETISGKLNIAK